MGFCGELLVEISFGTGERGGGASNKCHKFFPIAQTSSQEPPPMLIPCVLQSQAMSHARKVTPSTNDAYATWSSLASADNFLSRCNGLGLGGGRLSEWREVEGLLCEE